MHRPPITLIPGARHLPGLASRYVRSRHFRRVAHYTRYLSLPIETGTILYEDFHIEGGGGELEALFHEIAARPELARHHHVWVVDRLDDCPEFIRLHPRGKVVRRHDRRYLRHLATAALLISGSGEFPTYFIRRPEQRYVNTGARALLRVASATVDGDLARNANLRRNLAHTTHLVAPNHDLAKRILETHGLDGLYRGLVVAWNAEGSGTQRRTDEPPTFDAPAVVDALLGNGLSARRCEADRRIKLLFYCGSWSNNGITASAINLLNNLDPERYVVAVVDETEATSTRETNFAKVRTRVRRFGRVGTISASFLETARLRSCFANPEANFDLSPREVYRREYRRIFGDIEFDVAIDFSGYVKLWALVMATAPVRLRLIYQHSEMAPERWKTVGGRLKHKGNLDVIFKLYREFDHVVSVSRTAAEANRRELAETLGETPITVVENTLDVKAVLDGSLEPVDFGERRPGEVAFAAIGRLSPEKGHEKLLRAFALVCEKAPHARLYIAGDGPLRGALTVLIEELGLTEKVELLGHVSNPYALLRRSAALVQSSDYEGQPMVLLEAMALRVPIVATDIPGNRGVLGANSACLTSNDVEGLCNGMLQVIDGAVRPPHFDVAEYNCHALAKFETLVGGARDLPLDDSAIERIESPLLVRSAVELGSGDLSPKCVTHSLKETGFVVAHD